MAALARFLLEDALTKHGKALAARCGALRTRAVVRVTVILLLRVRYLIEQPEKTPVLSEEVFVLGYQHDERAEPNWLEDGESLRLLGEAQADANLPMAEKKELVGTAIETWKRIEKDIEPRLEKRAKSLEESHKRIRQAVSLRVRELTVTPQKPVDLLGLLVLQPVVHP